MLGPCVAQGLEQTLAAAVVVLVVGWCREPRATATWRAARHRPAAWPGAPAAGYTRACLGWDGGSASPRLRGALAEVQLTAGRGHYLREVANMTIGWPRGGGSRVGASAPLQV